MEAPNIWGNIAGIIQVFTQSAEYLHWRKHRMLSMAI